MSTIPYDFPESVEEAGALLGATITRIGKEVVNPRVPPRGMASAFGTIEPVPSAELLTRLHALRALLRSSPQDEPLVAAPSLLAVLMKLLGESTTLAAAQQQHHSASSSASKSAAGYRFDDTPPMLSTPLRSLWVDCVALCHVLGEGLSGTSKIVTTRFVQKMMDIALTNSRSSKAAGGVRIAALDVIGKLYASEALALQLAPWSLDVLQLCGKALRSAGNGEPTYRQAAVQTACATAVCCRTAYWKKRNMMMMGSNNNDTIGIVLRGALEDKAIVEVTKLLKQAVTDKFPEVRCQAAHCASLMAPMLIHSSSSSGGSAEGGGAGGGNLLSSLDDVMQIALRSMDDESPFCAHAWAEALARCMCTAVQYHQQEKASTSSGDASSSPSRGGGRHPHISSSYKQHSSPSHVCSSVTNALMWLIHQHFIKVGGELAAARAGGTFSTGGRAVRVGLSLTLVEFVRLEYVHGGIGALANDSAAHQEGISVTQTIHLILRMVGDDMEKQLTAQQADSGGSAPASAVANLFGGSRARSKGDAGLVRLAANRVLRQGLSEVASESVQLAMLHDFIGMIQNQIKRSNGEETPGSTPLNANQLQVILVEISHLYATLGEATASTIEDFLSSLDFLLSARDHGVRHECVVTCEAFCSIFPTQGRKLLKRTLDDMQFKFAEMVTLAVSRPASSSQRQVQPQQTAGPMGRFSRAAEHPQPQQPPDPSLPLQFAIHGRALLISVLVRDLAQLPGGIPAKRLDEMLSIAEMLVSFQFNDAMNTANPGGVCMCVRAGFSIIAGALTTGPEGTAFHMPFIFSAWKKCCSSATEGNANLHFLPRHDLFCLEAVLTSIVAFLKFCSELILSMPEALSSVTIVLEESLQLLAPKGKLGNIPMTPTILARIESAKASLLECFAWLPSGSFPLAADGVFALSAAHIRSAVENDVPCSILHSLLNKEDSLLDSKTWARARRTGQVGGAREVAATIATLTTETILHGEREAVMYLLSHDDPEPINDQSRKFHESAILGAYASEPRNTSFPTPLHKTGSWRRPIEPSSSVKIRLIDAAIQAFAATFGLKSGKEQQMAMNMLESLVPGSLSQLSRSLGINSPLTDDKRSKTKDDGSVGAAVVNIAAVLLSCLLALPLDEATHNVAIKISPPWMNTAKDLLLTLLPSPSTVIRRASAEGLALLATIGVTEDAHFLQSTVLHSLDELVQGNKPDGKPKAVTLEPSSAVRSGSLLTLACIQRTANNVAQRQLNKALERSSSPKEVAQVDEAIPVIQMLTRILPSVAYHGPFRDYFIVKTYALHAFCVLLSNSARLDAPELEDVDRHLLRKAVELVEGNFVASWTAASADADKGLEAEKMGSEIAFLTVLMRLMTFVIPFLHHLRSTRCEDSEIAHRFSVMTMVILERHSSHPAVFAEGMAFFEVLAAHRKLLAPVAPKVIYDEHPLYCSIPFIMEAPIRPTLFAVTVLGHGLTTRSCRSFRAMLRAAETLTLARVHVSSQSDMIAISRIAALLEVESGNRYFRGGSMLRSLCTEVDVEIVFGEGIALERELFDTLLSLQCLECLYTKSRSDMNLRWLLFARALIAGVGKRDADNESDDLFSRAGVTHTATSRAISDANIVFETAGVPRWQVKTLAVQVAAMVLDEFVSKGTSDGNPDVDIKAASTVCLKLCHEAKQKGESVPPSKLAFHLEDVLFSACMSSAATVDHSELRALQGSAMMYLSRVIACFGQSPDPENPGSGILEQYSTQIFSGVKHALNAAQESDSYDARRLFVEGCEALAAIISNNVTADTTALKRLLRPTVPTSREIPFFTMADNYPSDLSDSKQVEDDCDDLRGAQLIKVYKLRNFAKLMSDSTSVSVRELGHELLSNEVDAAVHCAAVALDGARLLLGSKLSLAGLPRGPSETVDTAPAECGFIFRNIRDVDDSVKASLCTAWSTCASYALGPLLRALRDEELDEATRAACLEWIKEIVPYVIAGLHDADQVLHMDSDEDVSVPQWAVVDAATVKVYCLEGIGTLVQLCPASEFQTSWKQQIDVALDRLRLSDILPILQDSETGTSHRGQHISVLAYNVCDLLDKLASSNSSCLDPDSSLLVAILTPLDLLEKDSIDFTRPYVDDLVSACLVAVGKLITENNAQDSLVGAMLHLSLGASGNVGYPEKVREASQGLLRSCVRHKSMDRAKQRQLATKLAEQSNWDAWSVVATIDDGLAIGESLAIVGTQLRNNGDSTTQLKVLTMLSKLCQSMSLTSSFLGCLLNGVGADILSVLLDYGTLRGIGGDDQMQRLAICTESLTLLLLGYQQIKENSDEEVSAYLMLLFGVLISVLRFNGLPNHPSPNQGGNETLGRISSQTILNIAKTTPGPFKTTLMRVTEHDRVLVEFAVRAEMSGYAVQAQKKKLDLKSFKK